MAACPYRKVAMSAAQARRAAKRPRQDGTRRYAYRCPACGQWHLAGRPVAKALMPHRSRPPYRTDEDLDP